MPDHKKYKVNKPKSSNFKSSDRRLASGVRPEGFLLSQQNNSSSIISNSQTKNPKSSGNINLELDNDWNPKHFRLFVGNLGSDANDSLLEQAFGKYTSLKKVRVPVDKSGENKGYGFVAFEDPNDYLKAFKELNGKYIGHNPCVLKKANDIKENSKKNKKGLKR